MFRILWVYLNAFFYVLFHIIPIRKRSKKPDKYNIDERFKHIDKLCDLIVRKSGSKVIVKGRNNIPNGPVLYVSNHPSMIDPYFLSYAIKKQLGAVIAGELWFDKIPILAPWFKTFGCIYLNRKNPREAIKGINDGINNIKKGHSLLLFPEGDVTNMITHEPIGHYQTGALKLAIRAQVPIVPIVITGTDKIYTAHEVIGKLNKGTIVIEVLEPYENHLYKKMKPKKIADTLYRMTKEKLYKLNNL